MAALTAMGSKRSQRRPTAALHLSSCFEIEVRVRRAASMYWMMAARRESSRTRPMSPVEISASTVPSTG